MGEEILRESKYSISLITVPFCPVAPCPFQILAGVLREIIAMWGPLPISMVLRSEGSSGALASQLGTDA